MATGIIVLDTYTIYYEGRYATYIPKALYSAATERQSLAKRFPHFTERKFVKPDAFQIKTTNRWFTQVTYIPPHADRYIAFNRYQIKGTNRYTYYTVDTKVRYVWYESYDNRPPQIIGTPKFLNWNEVPRTYYFKTDVWSPYPIVPETVIVSLRRIDKNETLVYSLDTTPDKLKVYPDEKRKDVYIIECHFGIVFDLGENIEVGLDVQNEYGYSLVQS